MNYLFPFLYYDNSLIFLIFFLTLKYQFFLGGGVCCFTLQLNLHTVMHVCFYLFIFLLSPIVDSHVSTCIHESSIISCFSCMGYLFTCCCLQCCIYAYPHFYLLLPFKGFVKQSLVCAYIFFLFMFVLFIIIVNVYFAVICQSLDDKTIFMHMGGKELPQKVQSDCHLSHTLRLLFIKKRKKVILRSQLFFL